MKCLPKSLQKIPMSWIVRLQQSLLVCVQLLKLQLKAYDTCMLLYIAVESRAVTETSNSPSSGVMVGVVIAFSIACAALVIGH